ncbi:MAG: CheR family methyltransferase [Polyangia bacterium]
MMIQQGRQHSTDAEADATTTTNLTNMDSLGDQGDREGGEIGAFLEEIYVRYGYDLRDYAPVSIRRRVRAVLARSGLRDLTELRRKVDSDPVFFASIVEHLTVRVSEMFRDPAFYRAFRSKVVPLLRTYPLLNIWHCGCASGEEVYSSAILLMEEGLYERSQIYATDLSPAAIEQARQGVYAAERLPLFASNYVQAGGTADFSRYYTAAYGRIAMRDSLRRKILFFQHDLVCDQVFSQMQVVFCRNVLIYFNHELRQRVIEKLRQSICHGGFLCLGSAERLSIAGPGTPQPPRTSGHREPAGSALGNVGPSGVFAEFAGDERIYRQCQ